MGDFIVFKDALKQYKERGGIYVHPYSGYIKIFVWSLNRNVVWFMGFYDLKSSNILLFVNLLFMYASGGMYTFWNNYFYCENFQQIEQSVACKL